MTSTCRFNLTLRLAAQAGRDWFVVGAPAGGLAGIESVGQAELVPEAEAPAPISSAALAPSGLAALPSTVTNSQVSAMQYRGLKF